ncbi:MAG: ERF family protein [Actinobacteria bacterium]|nr:ERF family protein [Actinomycetota bacterium]
MTTETRTGPTIYEALAAAKAAIGAVRKTGRNQQQGYNFRGVDAVVNAASPELNKQGVIVTPMLQSIEYDTVEVGQKRTPMAHVRVVVTYRFHGPAGDHIDAMVPGESMDSGDKAAPKAMSVAYRIALLQALNLPTDDADPDSQSYERSPRAQSAGDAFDSAAPGRPQNGRPAGQVSRPQRPQEPPAAVDGEPDPDAQVFFDEAHEARTVAVLGEVRNRAREAGKLSALGRNPATGGVGGFGAYANWRKKQLEEVEAALRELSEAAGQMPISEQEIHVRKVTGAGIEEATAAQLRQAAEALKAGAQA